MNTQLIEALLTEREGYARRNLADRVKQVDAELSAAGYKKSAPVVETATAEPTTEMASKPATRKRNAH
jgi:hypothetical protein